MQQSAHDLHVLGWLDSDDEVYTYGADAMSAPLNSGFSHSTETPSNPPVGRMHGEHPRCVLGQYSFILNLLKFEISVNTCGETQKERLVTCAPTCHIRTKRLVRMQTVVVRKNWLWTFSGENSIYGRTVFQWTTIYSL